MRRQPSQRDRPPSGFTIIESIVVLVIIAVLTWVVIALVKHRTDPQFPDAPPSSERLTSGGELFTC